MPSPSKARPIKPAKDGQPSKSSSVARKRQPSARISAACEACKKRKTKCTGGPSPCHLCETLGTECVIDLSLDMRRRAALQRTMDESKTYQDALTGLIDSIRDGPSPRLDTLVKYIRSGATIQEISSAIHHLSKNAQSRNFDPALASQQDLEQSPTEDGADGMDSRRGQNDALHTLDNNEPTSQDIASSLGSTVSDPAMAKENDESDSIPALLTKLKKYSLIEGERLLHHFIAAKIRDEAISPPWSEQSNKSLRDSSAQGVNRFNESVRSRWHPALHLQTRGSWADEQPPVSQQDHTACLHKLATTDTPFPRSVPEQGGRD